MVSWSVTGAASLSLSGVGAVTGTSSTVDPSKTTMYTLTATNADGSVTKTVTVTVTVAASNPIPAPTQAQSTAQSYEMGVVTHFGQDHGNVEANLNLIQDMGASTIRDEACFRWQTLLIRGPT